MPATASSGPPILLTTVITPDRRSLPLPTRRSLPSNCPWRTARCCNTRTRWTPRGFLSPRFAYYTHLTADQPQHRALIRYTAGSNVAFERVFSWLDTHLQTGDLDRPQAPAGSLVPARQLAIWGTANAPGEGLAYNADHLDENGQPLPITHRSSTLLSDALSRAPESLKM